MSLLVGIALLGERAELTVVDRRGRRRAYRHERLSRAAERWWETHPAETLRIVLALLEGAVREGLLVGGEVAGVGLAGPPGLVVLDPDLEPISPRELPWEDLGAATLPLAEMLPALATADPARFRKLGMVLAPLDYLRYGLTGALATTESLAWQLGLSGPRPGSWDRARLHALGLPFELFPPVFGPCQRVGVVQAEIAARTGILNGTWVHAGSDLPSAQVAFAAEPVLGHRVLVLEAGAAHAWRVGEAPAEWNPEVLPTAFPGVSLYPEPVPEPGAAAGLQGGGGAWTLCFGAAEDPTSWFSPGRLPGEVQVSIDAGGPSGGPALQAGLGIGWWRDSRVLWRKHRRAQTPADFLEQQARVEARAPAGEVLVAPTIPRSEAP